MRMSSAAVASAANGIARRSRVRGLDGLRKTSSFRATPPVTPPGEAAGSLKGTPRLVRCRSMTSAPAVGSARSYASSACITSSARRGLADEIGGAGTADGGRFLAGAAAVAGALAASSGEEQTNWGNDKTGGGATTSWGDDKFAGGRGSSTVWCDGSASRRLPPSLGSFRRRRENLARFSGSSSDSSSGESDVEQVVEAGSELRTFEGRLAVGAPPPVCITDVYRFEGNGEPVGRGQRATVSTATHLRTGQTVAVKKLARAETTRLEVRGGARVLFPGGEARVRCESLGLAY